jgi:hypothetical protein
MYYIKNAPETLPLPEIFENMRFPLPLPLHDLKLDHYIIFHLFWYFLGGKLELACRAHFRGRSSLGDLGFRNF